MRRAEQRNLMMSPSTNNVSELNVPSVLSDHCKCHSMDALNFQSSATAKGGHCGARPLLFRSQGFHLLTPPP